MRTRNNNPNSAVIALALRPGVSDVFRIAAESYIVTHIQGIKTFDDQARALEIGRSTWAKWRKRLGWPPPREPGRPKCPGDA